MPYMWPGEGLAKKHFSEDRRQKVSGVVTERLGYNKRWMIHPADAQHWTWTTEGWIVTDHTRRDIFVTFPTKAEAEEFARQHLIGQVPS